jgi:hypothetical protein
MDTITFEVPSLSGHRYALVVVDDYSPSCWAYNLHTKNQVTAFVKQRLTYLATQYPEGLVQTVRTDRRGSWQSGLPSHAIHDSTCFTWNQPSILLNRVSLKERRCGAPYTDFD